MREIAHNWISPVRIKVNASRIAAATASAAQPEDLGRETKPTGYVPYRLLWEERRLVSVANLYQVNPAAAPRRDHM
jgi:hypothetical protein